MTLLIAGIPAAVYERIRGLKASTPVSLGIWLVATVLLSLPDHHEGARRATIERASCASAATVRCRRSLVSSRAPFSHSAISGRENRASTRPAPSRRRRRGRDPEGRCGTATPRARTSHRPRKTGPPGTDRRSRAGGGSPAKWPRCAAHRPRPARAGGPSGCAPRKSIGQCSRKAWNPECISAETHLACARAAASLGHSAAWEWRWVSARNSRIARLSQTTRPSASSAGTLPEGECRRICALASGARRSMLISLKAMPAWRMASQGRRLQLDVFLLPITSR